MSNNISREASAAGAGKSRKLAVKENQAAMTVPPSVPRKAMQNVSYNN